MQNVGSFVWQKKSGVDIKYLRISKPLRWSFEAEAEAEAGLSGRSTYPPSTENSPIVLAN